jgi:hypothetical protein
MDDAEKPKGYKAPPNRATVIEREKIAWRMRTHGSTLQEIGDHLGVTAMGAWKICARVEEREARRLARSVHRVKARQSGQLQVVISEGFSSWKASKEPRRRAIRREGQDRETVDTTEATDQHGDVRYLHLVLAAHAAERDLCGLSIEAAMNPFDPRTLSDLTSTLGSPYAPKDQEDEPCTKDETASHESESDPRN